MDFKLSRGRIVGNPQLIKLCRPIRTLLQIMRNEIKEQCRRSLPQRKRNSAKEGKEKGSVSSVRKCAICFEFKPDSDMFKGFKCKHKFCTECLSNWVASEMNENINKVVACPNPKCSVELKPEFLQTILPEEVFVRWESARLESSIPLCQKTYCPYKDCSVLLVNDCGKNVTSSECPSCHRAFCEQCNVPWHAEMECEEFQKLKRIEGEKDMDTKFFHLAKTKKWRRCPKCNIYVERHSGCEHIKCRCGCQFCYDCGSMNWKFGHMCGNCGGR